jgi:predicted ester cyclase
MSEQNKALALRFYDEIFNAKNLNVIDELCAPDFVDHNAMPGQAPGAKGLKDVFTTFFRGLPDLRITIHELVAERDIVVARFTGTATHTGELLGAAPTGKAVTMRGMDMIRIKGGKAIEVWHEGDDAVVLMQLGVEMPSTT